VDQILPTAEVCGDTLDNDCNGTADDGCDGLPCDDGNACTSDDVYVGSTGTGTPYSCSDGLTCTTDICDGTGGCTNEIAAGNCLIDGTCYSSGEQSPSNSCQLCTPGTSQVTWTANDGFACDDGIFCTGVDVCVAGVCTGSGDPCPGSDGDSDCAETCNESSADCTGDDPLGSSCDDGDPGTINDICGGSGTCAGEALKSDGEACTFGPECFSGHCVDGVCCDSSCSGSCQSCLGASTGSVDGVCDFVISGLDPDNECVVPGDVCNGSGVCD
jgi:hypothetical protein